MGLMAFLRSKRRAPDPEVRTQRERSDRTLERVDRVLSDLRLFEEDVRVRRGPRT